MTRLGLLGSLLVALLFACATSTPPLTMTGPGARTRTPPAAPDARASTPRLVPYPGLNVSYVANGQGEIYFLNGRFYCYHADNWFAAPALDGSWEYVEMKYVPADQFRVRGQLPPGLKRANDPAVVPVAGAKK